MPASTPTELDAHKEGGGTTDFQLPFPIVIDANRVDGATVDFRVFVKHGSIVSTRSSCQSIEDANEGDDGATGSCYDDESVNHGAGVSSNHAVLVNALLSDLEGWWGSLRYHVSGADKDDVVYFMATVYRNGANDGSGRVIKAVLTSEMRLHIMLPPTTEEMQRAEIKALKEEVDRNEKTIARLQALANMAQADLTQCRKSAHEKAKACEEEKNALKSELKTNIESFRACSTNKATLQERVNELSKKNSDYKAKCWC
jgi:hypothetical protein